MPDVKEERLVIPFYDTNGNIFGIQGRTLKSDVNPKYITILDPDNGYGKLYGIDNVHDVEKIRVVEGPLDSLFVDNCIATCDADLLKFDKGDVYILDNDARSIHIIKRYQKIIDAGKNIVIWPNGIEEDINDMVLAGRDIETIINNNTYKGLKAKVKLGQWRIV